jgi:hypothetical protein
MSRQANFPTLTYCQTPGKADWEKVSLKSLKVNAFDIGNKCEGKEEDVGAFVYHVHIVNPASHETEGYNHIDAFTPDFPTGTAQQL